MDENCLIFFWPSIDAVLGCETEPRVIIIRLYFVNKYWSEDARPIHVRYIVEVFKQEY